MLHRSLWLVPIALIAPGCVMSITPLPSSYGPPVWQGQMAGPQTIVSTPAIQSQPYDAPAERRPTAEPENPLPPALDAPSARGTLAPSRPVNPRRVCGLPD